MSIHHSSQAGTIPPKEPGRRWRTRPTHRWTRRSVWVTGWVIAAGWAGFFPLFSDQATHRTWGLCAAVAYLCAAGAACLLPRPRAAELSVGLALTGAVVLPFVYLALTGQAQGEVEVIERAGTLLLHHGTPYLAHPRTVMDYTPYLPGMALFGMPRALLGDHSAAARLFGDARLWCAVALLLSLHAGRVVLRGHGSRAGDRAGSGGAGRREPSSYAIGVVVLTASPVIAMPLCVSGIDMPLIGLCCLGLALAARRRPVAAGLALAAACSLKWTALPAIAVAVVLLARDAGARAAVRGAVTSLAATVALVLPCALVSPSAMVQQVLAFPTGRGDLPTPAGSPMPGQLLAGTGTFGWYLTTALLLCGGLVVSVWLVLRPPAGAVAAADRLAAGLCTAFLLAPAGRFGYFALPVVLVLWSRRADPAHNTAARPATRPVALAARARSRPTTIPTHD
ncbi:glycosyltransferase 87 family protein [Streptomyces sp. NPDC014734]|uniref:glycosyltransferase 87 family protein n=1 Tax=Streptomyces sp. NPDC014734 TaxID=3364886 RepID=UPI0037000EE6